MFVQEEIKSPIWSPGILAVAYFLSFLTILSSYCSCSMCAGFIRDLTSEKAAKERMKRKEQLTQAMINSSFDAIFQINERGIIQMVNQVSM